MCLCFHEAPILGSRARVTACGARNLLLANRFAKFRPLRLFVLASSATGGARTRSYQFRHTRIFSCIILCLCFREAPILGSRARVCGRTQAFYTRTLRVLASPLHGSFRHTRILNCVLFVAGFHEAPILGSRARVCGRTQAFCTRTLRVLASPLHGSFRHTRILRKK